MSEFIKERNKKIAIGMADYWKTPEGMKRRERLRKRMRNPRKKARK